MDAHETLPAEVQTMFPRFGPIQIIEFSYQRNTYNLPNIMIGIAVLPPEE